MIYGIENDLMSGKEFMRFSDIQLKQPLKTVKRAEIKISELELLEMEIGRSKFKLFKKIKRLFLIRQMRKVPPQIDDESLVVPNRLVLDMISFFEKEKIGYILFGTDLYPDDQIKSGMQRYIDIDPSFAGEKPAVINTPFDSEALFQWTLQLCGETIDPSYREYLDQERRINDRRSRYQQEHPRRLFKGF